MKLTALIIDDEQQAREVIATYVAKYCPEVTILGQASNIQVAQELIAQYNPDFLFLDVEMPYGNGFDLLNALPDREFETIFVTAYDQYAIDALNEQAAYYLLKPISIDDLINAVSQIAKIKSAEARVIEVPSRPATVFQSERITIPTQSGFEVIVVQDILYCKADDNYTHVHLRESDKLVSKTLKHFEDMLTPYGFVRTHKSYLVNPNEIVAYQKGKGGMVTLSNGKELQVSSTRKSGLLSLFA